MCFGSSLICLGSKIHEGRHLHSNSYLSNSWSLFLYFQMQTIKNCASFCVLFYRDVCFKLTCNSRSNKAMSSIQNGSFSYYNNRPLIFLQQRDFAFVEANGHSTRQTVMLINLLRLATSLFPFTRPSQIHSFLIQILPSKKLLKPDTNQPQVKSSLSLAKQLIRNMHSNGLFLRMRSAFLLRSPFSRLKLTSLMGAQTNIQMSSSRQQIFQFQFKLFNFLLQLACFSTSCLRLLNKRQR